MLVKSCQTCKFWTQFEPEAGYCHRYPKQLQHLPSKNKDGSMGIITACSYPTMRATEWCGEHEFPLVTKVQ